MTCVIITGGPVRSAAGAGKATLLEALTSDFLQAAELDVLQATLRWGEDQLLRHMENRGEHEREGGREGQGCKREGWRKAGRGKGRKGGREELVKREREEGRWIDREREGKEGGMEVKIQNMERRRRKKRIGFFIIQCFPSSIFLFCYFVYSRCIFWAFCFFVPHPTCLGDGDFEFLKMYINSSYFFHFSSFPFIASLLFSIYESHCSLE